MGLNASIVIPLLNQKDTWLDQCVRSALAQTAACEVIVVVSPKTRQSNLRTLQRISIKSNTLRILPEQGNSFAGALNTGIRAAVTDRVGFLLSDDWLDDTAVEECLRFSTDIVSTSLTEYAADGTRRLFMNNNNVRKENTLSEFNRLKTLEEKANYLTHFFLFNKERLLAVGGVDERIGCTGPDDYDLIWTLLEDCATVTIVEKSRYNYRAHTEQRLTLRSREDQVEDLKKILDKHGVEGRARKRIIQSHSEWYGEAEFVVREKRKKITNRIRRLLRKVV